MAVRGLLGMALALAVAGCSGGGAAAGVNDPLQHNQIRAGLELHVWDESLVGAGADDFSIWVDYPDTTWVGVDVDVTNAVNLRALYFDLRYDPALLTPVGVDFTDRIAPADRRLEQIDLASSSGSIFASEVLSGATGMGYTGSGRLARVLFKRK